MCLAPAGPGEMTEEVVDVSLTQFQRAEEGCTLWNHVSDTSTTTTSAISLIFRTIPCP